jgi:hypothetical protein
MTSKQSSPPLNIILNDYIGRIWEFLANHSCALIQWNDPITARFVYKLENTAIELSFVAVYGERSSSLHHDADYASFLSPSWCRLCFVPLSIMMQITLRSSLHHDADYTSFLSLSWCRLRFVPLSIMMQITLRSSLHHDADYTSFLSPSWCRLHFVPLSIMMQITLRSSFHHNGERNKA